MRAEPVAEVCGVNLYANQVVDGGNRAQVERLCRYIARPPVAQDRLTRRSDGMLELAFKHPWKDGSRALILCPDDLLVRLCAAVPPPRGHQVRDFGVLSSHASLRPDVVGDRLRDDCAHRPPPAWGDQSGCCRSPCRDSPIPRSNNSDCPSTHSDAKGQARWRKVGSALLASPRTCAPGLAGDA